MSDEPILPPIPALSDDIRRKERMIEDKYSVIKCQNCHAKITRSFERGDFTFKKLTDKSCEKCKGQLTIDEIYSEWVDPKKKK